MWGCSKIFWLHYSRINSPTNNFSTTCSLNIFSRINSMISIATSVEIVALSQFLINFGGCLHTWSVSTQFCCLEIKLVYATYFCPILRWVSALVSVKLLQRFAVLLLILYFERFIGWSYHLSPSKKKKHYRVKSIYFLYNIDTGNN